jgi:MFS family permease
VSSVRSLVRSVGWWDAFASPGPIRILAINAVIDSTGTGLALVCLPFFAVRVAGLNARQFALALSTAGICELLAAIPNGAAASRLGIKSFNVLARIVQALAYTLLAFSHGFAMLLPAAALAAIARAGGNGLGQTLTAAAVGEQRSAALGAIRALRNIGYLLSGLLSTVVLATRSDTGLRLCLLANALSFLAGGCLIARLKLATSAAERPAANKVSWLVLRDAQYFGLIAVAGVFTSSLSVLTIGLPLWALRHHQNIPAWTVATVVMINTLLVVVFQFRFSVRLKAIPSAIRGIGYSSLAFVAMAVLIAATAGASTWIAIPMLALAAISLTLGELLESPSWWTLSFELAPAEHRNEYMAAFDLSGASMTIVGPLAMAGIVAIGAPGWLLYGAAMLVTAACGTVIARRRAARMLVAVPSQSMSGGES